MPESMMPFDQRARPAAVGLLLFGSGACALIYQTVWLREFRLIFGASTAGSAVVLAIFMGGLGRGSIVIGKRVDAHRNPLALYGLLEVGVAASAILTPLLLWVVRHFYLAVGGSFALGSFFAAVVRLVLSVIVLAAPTVLMGGTLPAASRAVERAGDAERFGVSVLYACNALGAVAGTIFSTFYLLENFGNLKTLICAALFNALIGMSGIMMAKARDETDGVGTTPGQPAGRWRYVYAAAAIVGFAFFLMELVWYRLLTPILGGTTYTFGLILAVALAGIGGGGFAYALLRRTRGTLGAFAVLCAG